MRPKSLLEHVKKNPAATYFKKDGSRETIASIYKLIERAVSDQANTLEFNKVGWKWSKNSTIIYRTNFGLGFPDSDMRPLWEANKRAIHKILAGDPIAARYIRLIEETDDEIVLEFVEPPPDESPSGFFVRLRSIIKKVMPI